MAITFITGVAGSGKSYFSVYTIYKMFTNKPKYSIFDKFTKKTVYSPADFNIKYNYVYTNINQFNFDFHPLLKSLNFDDLYKKLNKLRHLKVDKDLTDDELIPYAKDLGLFEVLLVVDEAQDYFPKKADEVLLWWLTYHRHLKQDIHILTQHIDQLSKEYLKNGVYFYRMPPPSMAIFSNRFTVSYFSCVGMTQKCREKSFTIPFDSKIGSMYVSGDKVERKSIFKKFFLIFPLLIGFFWGAWIWFNHEREVISPVHKKNSSVVDSSVVVSSVSSSPVVPDLSLKKKHFLSFRCIGDNCIYKNSHIPLDFVLYLKRKVNSDYSHTKYYSFAVTSYSFIVNDDTYSFIQDSFDNESSIKKKEKISPYEQSQNISLFGGKK